MKNKITIVDYGVGNLLSINRAVEKCGHESIVTSDENTISKASHIILPGVGAFKYAMDELKKRNLDKALKFASSKGNFILGICLGMQLLFQNSKEFGLTNGLGLIKGDVVPVPEIDIYGKIQKIPIIGWYEIKKLNEIILKNKFFIELNHSNFVYFVHSFMAQPDDFSNILAHYEYGGHNIPALIKKENIFGCQFHPEKSGNIGLKIINSFCSMI